MMPSRAATCRRVSSRPNLAHGSPEVHGGLALALALGAARTSPTMGPAAVAGAMAPPRGAHSRTGSFSSRPGSRAGSYTNLSMLVRFGLPLGLLHVCANHYKGEECEGDGEGTLTVWSQSLLHLLL